MVDATLCKIFGRLDVCLLQAGDAGHAGFAAEHQTSVDDQFDAGLFGRIDCRLAVQPSVDAGGRVRHEEEDFCTG